MKKSFNYLFVIFLICFCNVRLVYGSARSKVDYVAKLNELVKNGRDESLNAAPFYKKAAELCVKQPEEIKREDFYKWPSELTSKKQSLLRQWVKSNANAFAQLKLGTQKPYYWNQYQGDLVWALPPSYLSEVKYIVHAAISEVKLRAMEAGMTKEIIDDLLTCCRFSSHLTQAPEPVEHLVGIKIIDIVAQTVFLCLEKKDFSQTEMEMLESSLRKEFSKNKNQKFNLELEKFRHLETVQGLFQSTDNDSKLRPDAQLDFAARWSDLSYEYLEILSRGRTVSDIEIAFAYCKEFMDLSPWQSREKGLNFWEDLNKKTDRNPIVRFWMFNVPAVARVRAQYDANMDALLVTLALLRYKFKNDKFPSNLQELISDNYLSQLPKDPYSNESFVYKQTENNFTLYSLGEDFDDDGGTHSFWGRYERGGDYVFWPVQPRN